ncbi:hypothetical protein TIFTF001_028271 [Ficus carica]|uniref:FAD-binding PCMH-type domain-containing protein n=1 Tax=Ficus carica TaxID=3494 RepID=A0AA88DPH9_FICCA|nr:hypothetical protein TIFTF001_028271 [Ficus carica]
MKYFRFYSSFSKIFISLFSVLVAGSANTPEDFLECLVTNVSNSTATHEPIFYTSNDSLYSSVLNSFIRNHRFFSPSTPKPSVIVPPFHVCHVQATVYCSKKHGMQIRIRSGGHDAEGLSYVSYFNGPGFVVIDLRNLNLVSVDVESKSAWIGGGGYGYLTRKYGLAADNILDAELVDAEGRILDRKSMGEDLFWAIRGGGPASFGIVLAWKVRLVPVPSTVTVFDVWRNMEHDATKKFVHRWQRRANKVDEDLTICVTFQTFASSKIHHKDKGKNSTEIVVKANVRGTFHGGVSRLLELMQREFPELGLERQECSEMSTSNFDSSPRKGRSDFVKEPIPDDVLETLLERLYEEDVGRAVISAFPYGGKMNVILESAIPFPHRAGNLYMIYYMVRWEEEEEEEKPVSWLRKLYNDMTPYVSQNPRATYFNFRDLDIGTNNLNEGDTTSITQASIWGTKYFKNNFCRLIQVKTSVDPTNFFINEQSIPPLLNYTLKM